MPSMGPANEAAFNRAGIPDAETLRALGADSAYHRVLVAGEKPHFIWYYVLVMSLQGRPWNDAQGEEKLALRARFDAIKAAALAERRASPDHLDPTLEAALDALGVVPGTRLKGVPGAQSGGAVRMRRQAGSP